MAAAKIAEPRRSQEERRDESRAKILAAAEQIFARDGLAGARTDAIAAAAGVNKALLYYYFKSKDHIYEAVVESQLREFTEQALTLLNGPGSPPDVLLEYVNLHFDFISERHRHAPLFQQLMMKRDKMLERMFAKYIAPRAEAVQRLIERGTKSGDFRELDPVHTSISLAALVIFYFSSAPMMQRAGYPDPLAPANIALRKREVLDFIRYGLFNRPEKA